MEHFEPIFEILDQAGVRYVVVGGVAVNLHGHQRFTKDLDLVLELTGDDLLPALRALRDAGYRPAQPVAMEDFADPVVRERWITEKGMRVFQIHHDDRRVTVDLMVEVPIDFETLWAEATEVELRRTSVRVASIDHLIRMKELADRPQDRIDVEALRTIQRFLAEEGDEEP